MAAEGDWPIACSGQKGERMDWDRNEPWEFVFTPGLTLRETRIARRPYVSSVADYLFRRRPARVSIRYRTLNAARRCLQAQLAAITRGNIPGTRDWQRLTAACRRLADDGAALERLCSKGGGRAARRGERAEASDDAVGADGQLKRESARVLALQLADVLKVRAYLICSSEPSATPAWLERELLEWRVPDELQARSVVLYAVFLSILAYRRVWPSAAVHDNVLALHQASTSSASSYQLIEAYAEVILAVVENPAGGPQSRAALRALDTAIAPVLGRAPQLSLLRAASSLNAALGLRLLRGDAELEAGATLAKALAYDPYSAEARERLALLAGLPDELRDHAAKTARPEAARRLTQREALLREAVQRADDYLRSPDADAWRVRFLVSCREELIASLALDACTDRPVEAAAWLVAQIDEAVSELSSLPPPLHVDQVATIMQSVRERARVARPELATIDWSRIAVALRQMSAPTGALLALTLPKPAREAVAEWLASCAQRPKQPAPRPSWAARWRARPDLPYELAAGFGLVALIVTGLSWARESGVERRREASFRALLQASAQHDAAETERQARLVLQRVDAKDPRARRAASLLAAAVLRQALALRRANQLEQAEALIKRYADTPALSQVRAR